MIDSTGTTLGMMIGKATGDEDLGDMVQRGISDTGNELLSGKRLSLSSKILPIAKRSVNLVVDEIEDPKYKAIAKQIVKKSGAGLYGKAGSGLTGQGLRGQGLSGSGMRKRYAGGKNKNHVEELEARILPHRPMPRYGKERPSIMRPAVMPRGYVRTLPEQGRNVIKPYPRRMPRFVKRVTRSKRLHGIYS